MLFSAVPGGDRASGVLHVIVNSLEPRLLPDILKDPIGNKFITNFMGYPVFHMYATLFT